MQNNSLNTLEIRQILRFVTNKCEDILESDDLRNAIKEILAKLQLINPINDGLDNHWTFWVKSERGDISLFDDFEELMEMGEVESYEEYIELWKMEYPHEREWHKFAAVEYKNSLYFSIDSTHLFEYNTINQQIIGFPNNNEEIQGLLIKLLENVKSEIDSFIKDHKKYNAELDENLPKRKKFGRIKRSLLWEKIPDFARYDNELGKSNLKAFEKLINEIDESKCLDNITLNDFLRYCEICYNANGYFENERANLSPIEKYRAMADGRHGGMLDIEPNSPDAFKTWYKSSVWLGTHPWEICRGGNSTHIKLQVTETPNGWKLYLAGLYRQVDTINMALALYERRIPFVLSNMMELFRMVSGTDYLGIVSEDITPRYCHSFFPKEDEIVVFLNPWHDEELIKVIEDNATWYPLKQLYPKNVR
jgi:hypothetical protein